MYNTYTQSQTHTRTHIHAGMCTYTHKHTRKSTQEANHVTVRSVCAYPFGNDSNGYATSLSRQALPNNDRNALAFWFGEGSLTLFPFFTGERDMIL